MHVCMYVCMFVYPAQINGINIICKVGVETRVIILMLRFCCWETQQCTSVLTLGQTRTVAGNSSNGRRGGEYINEGSSSSQDDRTELQDNNILSCANGNPSAVRAAVVSMR